MTQTYRPMAQCDLSMVVPTSIAHPAAYRILFLRILFLMSLVRSLIRPIFLPRTDDSHCDYLLKKSDIGIILKQCDNVFRKNFISVALGIQIPLNNVEISAKAMCNARTDQERTLTPKTIFVQIRITFISPMVYLIHAITSSMNGKPLLVR